MAILDESQGFVTTRDKILRYLLVNRTRSGECCTIKEIASELGLSTNATRQYMVVLEKDGLVTRMERKGSTGRPAMTYTLHENAFETFPKVYKDFALSLLEVIRELHGTEETVKILKIVGRKLAEELKELIEATLERGISIESLSTRERLEKIADLFQQYGKYPELLEDDSSFAIKNFNCLVYGIVKEDPLVCKVDEEMMTELAGKRCTKERCIRDGDECCVYRIDKGTD